jgi:hypothetical protein
MAPLPAFATVGVASAVVVVKEVDAPDTVEDVPLPVGVTVKVYAVVADRLEIVQLCAPVGIVTVLATVQVPPGVPFTV